MRSKQEIEGAVSKLLGEQGFDQIDYGGATGEPQPAREPAGLNDWGSCQYEDAYEVFMELKQVQQGSGVEGTIRKIREEEGYDLSYSGVRPIEEAWPEFVADMKARGAELFDPIDDDGDDETDELLDTLTPSYDNMFRLARDSAWDLWTAAPVIAHMALEGFGQSADDETGALCWVLLASGAVQDESVFGNFDT